MEKLKKIISLNQAAKISGYTQDYLGYLVRQGEIKAQKVGRGWFTTEEEINNYLFKQKIKHKELAIPDFFSRRRTYNIVFVAILIFAGFFSFFFYMLNFPDVKDITANGLTTKTLSSEVELQETVKK